MSQKFHQFLFSLGLLCLVLSFLQSASVQAAEIIYVNASATGTNTGNDWENAYPDLQQALARAAAGDQIWVAAGIYKPGSERGDSFVLKNEVSLFGGFDGSESEIESRDWVTNLTVLSGDIDGDDVVDDGGITLTAEDISGSNSFHVVRATDLDDSAVINGFTVTGGQANGDFPDNQAGGMFNKTSSPTVEYVRFMGNTADDGGAVYNDTDSDATFTDVTFSGNSAPDGGAVYNWSSKPTFTNAIFSNNTSNARDDSTGDGGALYSFGSELAFNNVKFINNTATNAGGAIFNDSSSFVISDSSFSGNQADFGGGLSNFNNSGGSVTSSTFSSNSGNNGAGIYNNGGTTEITDSNFNDNAATSSGGAVFNNNESDGSMTGLTFSGNSAAKGGAIYNFLSSPTISNNKITANTADSGGGVYNEGGGSPIFINSQITGNRSNNQAGGMGNEGANPILINTTIAHNYARVSLGGILNNNANLQIRNSIIIGNVDNEGLGIGLDSQIRNLNGSESLVSYSLIAGSGGSNEWNNSAGIDKGGNIDSDPMFVSVIDPADTPTTDGNYQLGAGSVAIDAGSNEAYTGESSTDLAGNIRISDDAIDMGAFEAQQFELKIEIKGSGSITSTTGLSCAADCSKTYLSNTEETLTPIPADGFFFEGWEGACSGTGPCTIILDSDQEVTASFVEQPVITHELQVTGEGNGNGTVTSNPAGINCGINCTRSYVDGTMVVLTARAAAGSTFTGWSGSCSGRGACTIPMTEDQLVTANFAIQTGGPWLVQVSKRGTGTGTVISSPGGIECGRTCNDSFEGDTAIILIATADENSEFTGWSGDCNGVGSCLLTLTEDKIVSAIFTSTITDPSNLDHALYLPRAIKD